MQATSAYMPLHAAPTAVCPPAHMAAPVSGGARRVICTAGLAALLVVGGASMARASEIPDASWTPDVPSIDNSGSAPAPETPETVPVPEPDPGSSDQVEPPVQSEVPSGTQTPVDEGTGGAGGIPDSSTDVPSYEDTYGSGSTSSVGAGEEAFYDPETQAVEEIVDEPVAPAAVSMPTFVSYDTATRTFYGTAQPSSLVRIVTSDSNILGDVWTAEDGSFSFYLPEWWGIGDVYLFGIDEWGNPTTDTLAGPAIVEQIAQQEFDAVLVSVGLSTTGLAEEFSASLSGVAVASAFEQPAAESLPVLPYALGAGSALLAVAAVGGVTAVVRRSRNQSAPEVRTARQAPVSAPAFVPQASDGTPVSRAVADPVSARDEFDELEALAMSVVAGSDGSSASTPAVSAPHTKRAAAVAQQPSPIEAFRASLEELGAPAKVPMSVAPSPIDPDDDPTSPDGRPSGARFSGATAESTAAFLAVAPKPSQGVSSCLGTVSSNTGAAAVLFSFEDDPDCTIPCSHVSVPQDPETFAATARILATGSGAVHRVTASKQDIDFAGLDLIDDALPAVSPQIAADPLVSSEDWCAIALRELADDGFKPAKDSAVRGDTLAAVQGGAKSVQAEPAYVAPVIGPSPLSRADAKRRRDYVNEAATPAAAAIKSRDEAFRAQRECVSAQPHAGVSQFARGSAELVPARGVGVNPAGYETAHAPASSVSAACCTVTKDGVPIIARGAGDAGTPGPALRARSVSDRVSRQAPRVVVPDLDQAVSSTSEAEPFVPSVVAAVGAAQAAYAEYAPVSERFSVPEMSVHPVSGPTSASASIDVSGSVAAAYAAAVYGNVSAPEPACHETPSVRSVPAVIEEVDDVTARYNEYAAYSAPTLSSEYISYLVQEEFAHRHDTPAQRNAALGRMRIVNGAAQAPVSVRDGLNSRRHHA